MTATYLQDHLDKLNLTLREYRGNMPGTTASVRVGRLDGREFRAEADSVDDALCYAVAAAIRQIPLTDTAPLVVGSATIRVASVTGVCVHGYHPGCTWVVGRGRVRPRLCQPAMAALSGVLQSLSEGEQECRATCCCPLRDGTVEFVIRKAQT